MNNRQTTKDERQTTLDLRLSTLKNINVFLFFCSNPAIKNTLRTRLILPNYYTL